MCTNIKFTRLFCSWHIREVQQLRLDLWGFSSAHYQCTISPMNPTQLFICAFEFLRFFSVLIHQLQNENISNTICIKRSCLVPGHANISNLAPCQTLPLFVSIRLVWCYWPNGHNKKVFQTTFYKQSHIKMANFYALFFQVSYQLWNVKLLHNIPKTKSLPLPPPVVK